ncbi:hypothetical protein LEP1GSC125_2475 [Leptospira mayottensis 200901122]|uniref:Uncharacterized protein n=1 Tax=Leptospira mayottensis 200901122 TaxID=1193010 RepID=A0AA87SY82_9LEPT|nr:hypothetical protein LEP1GSC125_2475 [Leptospira mayottensis 200901122]
MTTLKLSSMSHFILIGFKFPVSPDLDPLFRVMVSFFLKQR